MLLFAASHFQHHLDSQVARSLFSVAVAIGFRCKAHAWTFKLRQNIPGFLGRPLRSTDLSRCFFAEKTTIAPGGPFRSLGLGRGSSSLAEASARRMKAALQPAEGAGPISPAVVGGEIQRPQNLRIFALHPEIIPLANEPGSKK